MTPILHTPAALQLIMRTLICMRGINYVIITAKLIYKHIG
jgi:hypothetical protein